ncbi:MAG: hypothetical protein AB7G80_06365 [Dongiaceae bacterium]
MTAKTIFRFFSVFLVLGCLSASPAKAQISGGGGAGISGVPVFDLSAIKEIQTTVQYLNEQINQLRQIQNIGRDIYSTLGNYIDPLLLQGLFELACGKFTLPQFDYYFAFNIQLPDIPRDACSFFGFGDGYQSNFWQRATATAKNAIITAERTFYTNPPQRDSSGNVTGPSSSAPASIDDRLRVQGARNRALEQETIKRWANGTHVISQASAANAQLDTLREKITAEENKTVLAQLGIQNNILITQTQLLTVLLSQEGGASSHEAMVSIIAQPTEMSSSTQMAGAPAELPRHIAQTPVNPQLAASR